MGTGVGSSSGGRGFGVSGESGRSGSCSMSPSYERLKKPVADGFTDSVLVFASEIAAVLNVA